MENQPTRSPVSDATTVPGTKGAEQSGRQGRSGRKALVALAAPPTLDSHGLPVGPVARLFDEWLTVRRASNRISSPRTVAGYRDDMARWATLLTTGQPAWDCLALDDLTRENLIGGLAAMNTAGLSVAARQRSMAPMRGLCRWLVRNGHLTADPTNDEDLEIRSAPRRLPSHFTDDELERITTVAAAGLDDQRASLRWPDRDLATIALLAGAGLRASELCQLHWSSINDLDQAEPAVRVVGKGGRERVVPLGPRTAGTVRRYRGQRRAHRDGPLAVQPTHAVIAAVDGSPITPSVLNSWTRHWLRASGVAPRPGAAAHAFRHTAADGWLANGATLAEVQALLGHASIGTTGIYTKVRPETLGAVVKAGRFEHVTQQDARR